MNLVNSKNNSSSEWLLISAPASRAPTPEADWEQCSNFDHFTDNAAKESLEIHHLRPISSNTQVAIVSLPRPTTPSQLFFSLRLTTEDEVRIQTLIKDLAEKNLLELGAHGITLNRRGLELKVVHPMRFMGHILSSTTLSNHLEVLKRKSFTYNRFTTEFANHMREKDQDLLIYAPGFAKHIGVETQAVVNVINSKKYIDLIHLKKT